MTESGIRILETASLHRALLCVCVRVCARVLWVFVTSASLHTTPTRSIIQESTFCGSEKTKYLSIIFLAGCSHPVVSSEKRPTAIPQSTPFDSFPAFQLSSTTSCNSATITRDMCDQNDKLHWLRRGPGNQRIEII